MASTTNGPPLPGYKYETRRPAIWAVSSIACTISLSIVLLRIYVRRNVTNSLGYDDGLIVVALLALFGLMATANWGTTMGYGEHKWEIDYDYIPNVRVMTVALPALAQTSSMFIQLSILALYLRFSLSNRMRYVCYGMIVLVIFSCTMHTIGNIVYCFPRRGDPYTSECFRREALWCSSAAIAILTEIAIWCIPIPLVRRLKRLSRPKRLGLIATFVMGLFAVVACAARFGVIKGGAKSNDESWDRALIALLSQTELCLGILCASMPPLRPLLSKAEWGWFMAMKAAKSPKRGRPDTADDGELFDSEVVLGKAGAGPQERVPLETIRKIDSNSLHIECNTHGNRIMIPDIEGLGVLGRLDIPPPPSIWPPSPTAEEGRFEGCFRPDTRGCEAIEEEDRPPLIPPPPPAAHIDGTRRGSMVSASSSPAAVDHKRISAGRGLKGFLRPLSFQGTFSGVGSSRPPSVGPGGFMRRGQTSHEPLSGDDGGGEWAVRKGMEDEIWAG
ncbi:hypothetical protein BDZ91DRAFT_737491 [Kalaharituber pfeilii]|nr:hypothetical protein BDZ91DRAFT_737491 [Kalaharituber pfeilii]